MAMMPYGWEGNRRSGVALAKRHRLQWFLHLRAHRLRKGDQHPTYTPLRIWHPLLARQAEGRQGLCSAADTFFLFLFFLTIAWSKEISESTRPIFTKFSELVEMWL